MTYDEVFQLFAEWSARFPPGAHAFHWHSEGTTSQYLEVRVTDLHVSKCPPVVRIRVADHGKGKSYGALFCYRFRYWTPRSHRLPGLLSRVTTLPWNDLDTAVRRVVAATPSGAGTYAAVEKAFLSSKHQYKSLLAAR